RLDGCLTLRRVAVLLDPQLALLSRHLILEAAALDVGLGLLLAQVRLGLATPGVSGAPTRVALGVRLRLLEPTLAGQILAAGRLAGEFLGLTHDLADDPAGSPLGALMLSQTASPSGCSRYSPT